MQGLQLPRVSKLGEMWPNTEEPGFIDMHTFITSSTAQILVIAAAVADGEAQNVPALPQPRARSGEVGHFLQD